MADTEIVVQNPPIKSKTIYTQIIGAVLMLITFFGIDVTPETGQAILLVIGLVQGVVTWVIRKYFNGTPPTVEDIKVAASVENLVVVPLADVKPSLQASVAATT